MTFVDVAGAIVVAIEALGVGVILCGVIYAVGHAGFRLSRDRQPEQAYTLLRHGIGRALMLGLDLLIASEIVRSITTETLESVAVLGLTIVIRTFLSLTLAIELDGRLPWRRGKTRVEPPDEDVDERT